MELEPKLYVAAAFFCDSVLEEKDGTLSAIRIVDTIRVAVPEGAPEGTVPFTLLQLLIGVKAPGYTGAGNLSLQLFGPTHAEVPQLFPLKFPVKPLRTPTDAHTTGVNLNVTLAVQVKDLGLGRVEVRWNDELLTVVPFRLVGATPPEGAAPEGSTR